MTTGMKKKRFLNVGGNRKDIPVPSYFDGWDHILLDIDPAGNPDIVCDARELQTLEPDQFHAVYCSHNLEHYYHNEVPKVLQGFRHILKPSGFVMIIVPDLEQVMHTVVENNLDLDDILYSTNAGIPVLVRDVLYGWGFQMELSGQEYFSHKTGFTQNSLEKILKMNGFKYLFIQKPLYNLVMVAFMSKPTKWASDILGLTAQK